MTFLLDVNVLIALIDPGHVTHEAAHRWFETTGKADWSSCPITENGVVRIVGHPKYPNSPGSPATVASIVARMRDLPGHSFWPDDLSLAKSEIVDANKILTSAQVTDTYLLALAVSRGGMLASFDRRLTTTAVERGKAHLTIIPSG